MPGYIGIVHNANSIEHRAIARELQRQIKSKLPQWNLVFSSDGLCVYCAGAYSDSNGIYLLSRSRGLVLGRLFSSTTLVGDKRSPFVLSERVSTAVYDTQGRHLVDEYWGRYVAFVLAGDGTVHVLRDPTGALPCLLTNYKGVEVICSNIRDCADLGLLQPDINWTHIAGYLCFGHMVTRHTGLSSVVQVHAGECVNLGSAGRRSTFYWAPRDISCRRTLPCAEEAKHELRCTIQSCVAAWASCYDNILHELSGGLDSSIVLACLASSGHTANVICENHFTQEAAGDERRFARLAAKAASIRLVERPIQNSGRSLAAMFQSEKVASPTFLKFIPDTEVGRNTIAEDRLVEAVFSGQGGDHLFQSVRTSQIAAEYAWRIGFRRGLWTVITDTARFTREPVWSVAKTAIASGLFHNNEDPYCTQTSSPLLSDAARESLDLRIIRHPWVDAAVDLPACKQRQIFDIVDTQNFYRTARGKCDIVHPLIAQPIIELCLQIPSYVLTYGGIGRALVRDAFVGTVPCEILQRTTKGATTGYFSGLLLNNASLLKEMLPDGNLVHAGLIDRRKVEMAISDASLARGPDTLFTILDVFRAELWSRTWSSPASRAKHDLAHA